MTENSTPSAFTRRQWAALAGALTGVGTLSAQQTGAAPRDLIEEQRAAIVEALAEMRKVALDTTDEPIFRLVVR